MKDQQRGVGMADLAAGIEPQRNRSAGRVDREQIECVRLPAAAAATGAILGAGAGSPFGST